jgi:hypothetical protein
MFSTTQSRTALIKIIHKIMKNLLFSLITIVFSNFIGNAQIYTFFDKQSNSKLEYEFSNDGKDLNSFKIIFNLKISNDNEITIYDQLELNNSNFNSVEVLNTLCNNNYNAYKNKVGLEKLKMHSKIINNAIIDFKSKENYTTLHSLTSQGLFIFNSILNGSNRDANLKFSIHEGFILGICNFVCEEDMKFTYNEVEEYVYSEKTIDKENKGSQYLKDILPKLNKKELSLNDIRNELNIYFSQKLGAWPSGGECGCCGNYDGPCIYWSLACYAHDMACQKCQYWWCFSGCVPTSCHNNTLPWYP